MDTFTRFFQENQERFLSFAYSYIRNKVEAEDILMESMIALWENREKWENDSNLQALLKYVCVPKMISIPTDKENLICESPHLKRVNRI